MREAPILSLEPTRGLGHNNPPETLDPIDALDMRLAKTHRELVVRFIDLELGCARVPNPIGTEAEAAATTDFIAQCQSHIKRAESAHRKEKEYFLKAARIVDGFFKRRCTKLTGALAPVALRLKAYRDQIAELDAKRHEEARRASEAQAQRAAEEEAEYRAAANRLVQEARSPVERQRAAEHWLLAEAAAKRRHRATPIVTRFSMAMAQRAGLTRSEGPWQTYPERMLRMRARSWTMRDAFADVLRGLQLREEVEDYVERVRAPHREVSPIGNLRHYPSPRPRRADGPGGASLLNGRPAVSELRNGHSQDQPVAEPLSAETTYALIDADGVCTEVVGPDALRAGFAEMFVDKHLSPDQIAGMWESNETARRTIEQLFGPRALAEAHERLRSLQERSSPGDGQSGPPALSQNGAASGKGPGQDRPSAPDRALVLEIKATWGVQKIFQQYRAALNALCDNPARDKPTIARFREANLGVEERLRAKLSGRMGQIDAIYRRAGLDA